jgi:hypothetical protein
VIEDALREGTTGSGSTKGLGETEGLSDREEGLNHDERGSLDGLFTLNDTTTLGEATVDTTNSIIRALNLDQENGLLEAGLSSKLASEEDTSGSWGDLTTTSVDSVGVESHILQVEADTSHVLISHDTFFGGPLEGSLAGVLDFVHELALLGCINKQVSSSCLRTEAPDLLGIVRIPLVLVLQDLVSDFNILFGGNFLLFDGVGKFVSKRQSSGENSVVLVG